MSFMDLNLLIIPRLRIHISMTQLLVTNRKTSGYMKNGKIIKMKQEREFFISFVDILSRK